MSFLLVNLMHRRKLDLERLVDQPFSRVLRIS